MATNVLSNDIRIFPSSRRTDSSGHYGDNFVTEYNLSSIINKLLYQAGASTNSQNGFLITTNPNDDNIEFNIGGYFVKAPKSAILNAINNVSSGGDTAYQNFVTFSVADNVVSASINIIGDTGSEEAYRYMGGSDGVSASATPPSGTDQDRTNITLRIMRVSGSPYKFSGLYTESKLRLTNFGIDDGIL